MKKILILGASNFQIPVVKQAKSMGLYVGVVDISAHAPAIPFADEFFNCSIKNEERVLEIAKEFRADAVCVGICDSAMNTAAYICEKMNLPGTSREIAYRATNKYEMIKAFAASGVAHPQFQYVPANKIEEFVPAIPYPLISKPVDSAGSKGINIIHSKEDLLSSLKSSSASSTSGDVLIEEYMTGPEVSVELIIQEGNPVVAQVTDKITTGEPHFIEIGHTQPSVLNPDDLQKIKNLACKAAEAIGLQNSIGHAEIKLTEDGPKMVEIAGRLGGDSIAEQLIMLSTGINLPEMAINFSLGKKNDILPPESKNFSAIRFILADHVGVLSEIKGIDDAKEIEDVKEVGLLVERYAEIKTTCDNATRLGYVISAAKNRNDAISACEKALSKIEFVFS